jgi:predicted dehydrogenase
LSAYTTLLQPHLAPVDTVNSIWQLSNGVSGTVSISFGIPSGNGAEYNVFCEKGRVKVLDKKVTIVEGVGKDAKTEEKEFPDEGSGVKQEVAAWAKKLTEEKTRFSFQTNSEQNPAQALADLEILEMMLRSGEANGAVQTLKYQT